MLIIIAGAGVLGRRLATMLLKNRHDVVIVERDRDSCDSVYAESGAVTVHGSATDLHVLEEAGAREADVLLATLHRDSDNLACCVLAKSLGVERIIVRMRDPSYETALRAAGATHVLRMTELLASQALLHVEMPVLQEVMSLRSGALRVFSVQVPARAWCVGRSVREIVADPAFPDQSLMVSLFRTDGLSFAIPRGDDCVHAGDTVLSIARPAAIEAVVAVLTRMA